DKRPALYAAIHDDVRVLVMAQTSKTRSPVWSAAGTVFDQKVVVFPGAFDSTFAMLASSLHVSWSVAQGSTLRTDPVYTPTDCFETFPFPGRLEDLAQLGVAYHAARQKFLTERKVGLTELYNRFHDQDSPEEEL